VRTVKVKIPAKWDKEWRETSTYGRDVMLQEAKIRVGQAIVNAEKKEVEIALD
jgi:hypothetical protein